MTKKFIGRIFFELNFELNEDDVKNFVDVKDTNNLTNEEWDTACEVYLKSVKKNIHLPLAEHEYEVINNENSCSIS